MKEPYNNKSLFQFRNKATLGLSIVSLVILPPLMINNFANDRILVGIETALVILGFTIQAFLLYTKRSVQKFTSYVFTPCVILFLVSIIVTQKLVGMMWCYPSIIAFYFMIPRLHAIVATLLLLAGAVPAMFLVLDIEVAFRGMATLITTGAFSATFVMLVERHQREIELKEIQRREAMANVSHELRTPLATLLAQIEAMIDGIRPMNTSSLQNLSNDVSHINALVDDLFLLSQSDIHAINYQLKPVDIEQIFMDAAQTAQIALKDRNLTIDTDFSKQKLAVSDPQRIRQVFDNLIQNCCRYTNEGGKIFVKTSDHSRHLTFTISDTGPGVNNDELPLIFDRFYRVEKSRVRAKGGSGLGLSLVQALILGQGGEVKAFNANKGGLGIEISLSKSV